VIKTAYDVAGHDAVDSPALVFYTGGILKNIGLCVEMAGGAGRLWPHVKTHKLAEIVKMKQNAGISRFKCATIAEAEMLGQCGAKHILLAYPAVGPAIGRFIRLMIKFPGSEWWVTGDDDGALFELDARAGEAGVRPNVLIDVNVGMDRTGVLPEDLEAFYLRQAARENIRVRGLHCYDGHIHEADFFVRKRLADAASEKVFTIRNILLSRGVDCGTVVIGGTPTFPCHAGREGVFCSPGTAFVYDGGYTKTYADLPFEPAAALLTRVVSRPARGLFTVDLGYKGISADPAGERGYIANLPGAVSVAQSEEHWVFRYGGPDAAPEVGDVLYVIPTHICPTVALYREALAVTDGRVADTWRVTARDRVLTI